MSKTKPVKRLFLLAAYDAAGHVDASLVHYVRALAAHGDIVVHMDSDCTDGSIKKLGPYTLCATAARHGEYDFGSYKRAYQYAYDAGILDQYDFVYILNDSVYGPLMDIGPALIDMESRGWDMFGLVYNPNRDHPHIQSWFVGMRPCAFRTKWFDTFIRGVTKLPSKGLITRMYEHRLTALGRENGLSIGCLYTVKNRGVYNRIKYLYRRHMPFMKKVAFSRHNGALGRQISYVMRHIDAATRDAILENARRTWGDEYVARLITSNPLRIFARKIRYAATKISGGKL